MRSGSPAASRSQRTPAAKPEHSPICKVVCKVNSMTVRTLEALHLDRSPLVHVLAQVRFAPVLTIENYVPGIQEHLRKEDFPLFNVRTLRSIEFGPQVTQTESKNWVFGNQDASAALVLTQNSLVLETNAYSSFERFLEPLVCALRILMETAGPSFSERIGLRYVDAVRPRQDEPLSDYLAPGLLGLDFESLGLAAGIFRFEATAQSGDDSHMIFKVLQQAEGSLLPPDLRQTGLDYTELQGDLNDGELITLLDIDHFRTKREKFDPDTVERELWKLHDLTDRTFRNVTTDKALRVWGEDR